MSARPGFPDRTHALARLHDALAIRDEWLVAGLSTQPADRDRAESAISQLYGLVGARAPAFHWVTSPNAATKFLATHGSLARTADIRLTDQPTAHWPVAHRLATAGGALRHAFDHILAPRRLSWDRELSQHAILLNRVGPVEAVRSGVPLELAVEVGIQSALLNSIEDSLRVPIRDELATRAGPPHWLAWYGQHEVWPAVLDICRQIELIRLSRQQAAHLDLWTALNRSCGWWWPLDDVCVIAERPLVVRTEVRPGPDHAGRRLHSADGAAVAYPDGWRVHSWHGTRVPGWIITDPSPERVARESNVEVRRCAIERIGWDQFIGAADLHLLAATTDPGNPDCQLRLYQVPESAWGSTVRLLVVTNGSVERDGTRRTYGLTVPARIDHPLTAAAWTYGLPSYVYAHLARRT